MARIRNRAESSGLAELFEICVTKAIQWGADDLADVFHHQLGTPLLEKLRPTIEQLQALESGADADALNRKRITTLGDLLSDSRPPLDLLRLVKDDAKEAESRSGDAPPLMVARAVYILTLAVALVRLGERISAMTDSDLLEGFTWIAKQFWIDAAFHQLAGEAILLLERH
jgi:hypothetical protein